MFQFIIELVLVFIFPILYVIFFLGTIIPYLAVLVRRLHDTNRTGWWVLIVFIPILGFIAWLIFTISEGDRGENRYGPNPLLSPTGMSFEGVEGDRSFQSEARFCTNCGSALELNANFCRSCGTAV